MTWRLAILCAAVLMSGTTARGQSDHRSVRLYGHALFRLGPLPDMTAAERASRVEDRLNRLLRRPEAIAPARVTPAGANGSDRAITIAGLPIVTVTATDAEENLTGIDMLARQWANVLDKAMEGARRQPPTRWGAFLLEVQGAFRAAFGRLVEASVAVIPRALAALLVILLFWTLAAGARRIVGSLLRKVPADRTSASLVKQAAFYGLWATGLLVAGSALGFDVQTVVTGLGLTSLALGFALKDVLSNFISGMLLLLLRPFQLGDQIKVGETEGSVERIELRATQIRTYDGRMVYVPNAELFTSRVTNNTAAPVRQAAVQFFVGYDQDLPKAVQVLEQAARSAAGVLPDRPVAVRIANLGQDDIELDVRFWADSRRSDFSLTTSAVRRGVVAACKSNGIALPDPSERKVRLPHVRQEASAERNRNGSREPDGE